MQNNYVMSPIGIEQLKRFEGCKLKAYRDQAGIWTNGYGNTHNVKPNSTITQAQADQDLLTNIATFEQAINELVSVVISQNQYDALVSFTFNIGVGAFKSSTLLKLLNGGDFKGAQAQFTRWNKLTNPKTGLKEANKGLTNRRIAEARLFGLDSELKPLQTSRTIKTAGVTVASGVGTVISAAPELIKDNLDLLAFFTDWRIIFGIAVIACGLYAAYLKVQDRNIGK